MADRGLRISPVGERAVVQLKSRGSVLPQPLQVGCDFLAGVQVLTLGPGEWLAVGDHMDAAQLRERLDQYLTGQGVTSVDLSSGFKALRIEGSAARQLLSKGCGLDLDPQTFPAGRSTRTRFAQLAVIVHCLDATPCFELYVGRSFLAWLTSWLLDAAAEFEG
jgi:sarcosine oxidase, subunit gamma